MASYNEMISSFGKSINEIASEFAGVDNYAKTIFPGLKKLEEEFAQTIAGDTKLSSSLMDDKVQRTVRETLEGIEGIPNIDEIVNKVHAQTYEKDIDGLADIIAKHSDKADIAVNIMKDDAKEVIDAGLNPNNLSLGLIDKAKKYPKAYFFSHPDKKIRNTRIGTAVGVYAGVSVGGRYLSGGTLTTDSYGRKDIAGIPLL